MKKYRLYDMYDYMGVKLSPRNRVGEYYTMAGVRAGAAEYDRDCDGECALFLCEYNVEAGRFLAIDAKPFTDYDPEVD